jgi:hypothetical protein
LEIPTALYEITGVSRAFSSSGRVMETSLSC